MTEPMQRTFILIGMLSAVMHPGSAILLARTLVNTGDASPDAVLDALEHATVMTGPEIVAFVRQYETLLACMDSSSTQTVSRLDLTLLAPSTN